MAEYKQFLTEIGYLLPEGDDFKVHHRQRGMMKSAPSPARSWLCP